MRMTVWGAVVIGPALHFWYKGLERTFGPSQDFKNAVCFNIYEYETEGKIWFQIKGEKCGLDSGFFFVIY